MTITLQNFNQDAYPATDEFQCLQLIIPAGDEYKWLLAGLMRFAGLESSYMDPESAQAEGLAQLWQDAFLATDWSGCVPPDSLGYTNTVNLLAVFAAVSSGAALNRAVDTLQAFNSLVSQNPAANGDTRIHSAYLPAGTYKARLLYAKTAASGKIYVFATNETTLYQADIWVDLDLYNASSLRNQVIEADFTLTEDCQRVYTQVVGKNASSSGFGMFLTALNIERQDF